jgi:hypothetical protein
LRDVDIPRLHPLDLVPPRHARDAGYCKRTRQAGRRIRTGMQRHCA